MDTAIVLKALQLLWMDGIEVYNGWGLSCISESSKGGAKSCKSIGLWFLTRGNEMFKCFFFKIILKMTRRTFANLWLCASCTHTWTRGLSSQNLTCDFPSRLLHSTCSMELPLKSIQKVEYLTHVISLLHELHWFQVQLRSGAIQRYWL